MQITGGDNFLKLELFADRPWALLVIDDKWDAVKEMAVGLTDPVTGTKRDGLGEACLDKDVVLDWWQKNRATSEEPLEKALALIPWCVKDVDAFGSVSFCGFPGNATHLQDVLHRSGLGCDSAGTSRFNPLCAALIDIRDASLPRDADERFTETWLVLDALLHPTYARAKFTRGGATLPSWSDPVPKIHKDPPADEWTGFKNVIQEWLRRVAGVISGGRFQELTAGSDSHFPSRITTAPIDQVQRVCRELSATDLYGVWRWVGRDVQRSPLPATAGHRWLAAKTFQTWPIDKRIVPITAIVAICEGARELVPNVPWSYEVTSSLFAIAPKDLDRLRELGEIALADGTYGDFARALRGWVANPEQFLSGNSRLRRIALTTESRRMSMAFDYSGPLPGTIFDPNSSGRRGQMSAAWDTLARCGTGVEHSGPTVRLRFDLA